MIPRLRQRRYNGNTMSDRDNLSSLVLKHWSRYHPKMLLELRQLGRLEDAPAEISALLAAVTALETGVVVGGVSALSAALYSIGIPHDSVVQYEADVQADDFLVVVQGSTADIEKARDVLGTAGARSVQAHEAAVVTSPPAVPVTAEPIHA